MPVRKRRGRGGHERCGGDACCHREIPHGGRQHDRGTTSGRHADCEEPAEHGPGSQVQQEGDDYAGVADPQLEFAGDLPEEYEETRFPRPWPAAARVP